MTAPAVERLAAFRRDVEAEPEVLDRVLDVYGGSSSPLGELPATSRLAASRILMTGMGSSHDACVAAAWWLRRAGIAVWVEYASEVDATPRDGPWTLVAVSQSGGTRETRRAIESFRATNSGLVIAVTNREPSVIAEAADVLLPLLAGEEGGISAKSYVASVAVLTLLAGRVLDGAAGLRADDLRSAPDASRRVIDDWPAWSERFGDLIASARVVQVLGSGAGWAAAQEGALIFKEAPELAAEAALTADFLHGAFHLIDEGLTAILLPDAPTGWRDGEARDKILDGGGRLVAIGGEGRATLTYPLAPLSVAARPLVEITPIELAAADLWAARLGSEAVAGAGALETVAR
jgi:fructoselysine-6-P-deglycase FrlB-like protein